MRARYLYLRKERGDWAKGYVIALHQNHWIEKGYMPKGYDERVPVEVWNKRA